MVDFILLYFSSIPVEIRITIILAILLSVSAFVMSGASVFLFYKFYRDTIKPIPVLLFEANQALVSLKLINNGHSAFYIGKLLVLKNNRITDNLVGSLPMFGRDQPYASFATSVEGRKVMPDQSIRLFEIDLAFAGNGLSGGEYLELLSGLNDLVVEVHCHDIGRRYKSVARESIHLPESIGGEQTERRG